MPRRTVFLLILCLLLAACSEADAPVSEPIATPLPPLGGEPVEPGGGEPAPSTLSNEALIEAVEVSILESFPVQVNALVRGTLPDSCVRVEQITQEQQETRFLLTVVTARLMGETCQEQPQPFEQVVSLDVLGLPAGGYSVIAAGANSATATFELSVDNVPPEPPAESQSSEAQPTEEQSGAGAIIEGIVWHDFCQTLEDGSPSDGCVVVEEGTYRADGVFNNGEARIEGVQVALRPGECPGDDQIFDAATTGPDGVYQFTGVQPGPHCVVINPAEPPNATILQPGRWTYPAPNQGSSTVVVAEGETRTADFGWDYQLEAPAAAAEEVPCTNAAAYVADVTIPDDTVLPAGEPFVKSWRVRNEGTCVWGPGYQLVFSDGAQLAGPNAVSLPEVVQPGEETELSVSLATPQAAGTYRSEWLLQSDEGELFGSRGDFPLYAQVVVQ